MRTLRRLWRLFRDSYRAARASRDPLLWEQKRASRMFDGKDVQTWPVPPTPETHATVLTFRRQA